MASRCPCEAQNPHTDRQETNVNRREILRPKSSGPPPLFSQKRRNQHPLFTG